MIDGQLIKCLLTNVPVEPLIKKLEERPDVWKQNTWRQDYVVEGERPISPQRDTEACMFMWAPENTIESVRDSHEVRFQQNFADFPELHKILLICLARAEATECGRVFIAKLKPGGHVIPHRDYGKYADKFERFHLVLTSEQGNHFFVDDERGNRESTYMKPGEFFWFNHKEAHWAINESASPRMHLIIDAVAPKYRRERANV